MKVITVVYFSLFLFLSLTGNSQLQTASTSAVAAIPLPIDLFDNEQVFGITLSGNTRTVLNDRADDSKYHPLTLSYFAKDSSEISFPIRVKTRGHFRKDKANCNYPPLMLNFEKSKQPATSLFQGQEKLKLVMPCRDDDYVIREWFVYKLYNLITPKSFRARLVKVTIGDETKKRKSSFYGILLEDEKQMARRNNLITIDKNLLSPQNTETQAFLTMAVFEYMIGNTDWSVQYQQNIKLLAKDESDMPATVPYDFDHSGMVDAPYAQPAEQLEMRSVMERRYRGYCVTDMKIFDGVVALFNRLKNDFYSVYTSCTLLDTKYVKKITRYLDDFYSTINDPKEMKAAFGYPCDPNGTGNVIIKGLRQD
ncbi:MAG: hypothetical protein JJE22_19015 [Bacteroidia bacterium]|nr:hypothetical protein [Bacteroidia bacterium]